MIRELVRDFAESTLAATISKRDDEQIAPTSEWQEFVELGLHGITVEEQYGGIPIDDVVEAIIVEELARVDPSFAVSMRYTSDYAAKQSPYTEPMNKRKSMPVDLQALMLVLTRFLKQEQVLMLLLYHVKPNFQMMERTTSSMV